MAAPYRRDGKCNDKPHIWPKPDHLPITSAWGQRMRLALASDLLRGRCRGVDAALFSLHAHLAAVNGLLSFINIVYKICLFI